MACDTGAAGCVPPHDQPPRTEQQQQQQGDARSAAAPAGPARPVTPLQHLAEQELEVVGHAAESRVRPFDSECGSIRTVSPGPSPAPSPRMSASAGAGNPLAPAARAANIFPAGGAPDVPRVPSARSRMGLARGP
eukprot:gene34234-8675_t